MNHPYRLVKRFWKYIDQRGPCWLWTGSLAKRGGYGQLNNKGRLLKAHRISFEIHSGPIPSGAHVLHKCNNAKCVNPEHLYLGDNLDNTRDRIEAGTQYKIPPMRGEKSPNAKLTEDQVKFIRSSSLGHAELGRKFNVTKQAIFRIRKNLSWKSIAQEKK